jgi:hypothetical protein
LVKLALAGQFHGCAGSNHPKLVFIFLMAHWTLVINSQCTGSNLSLILEKWSAISSSMNKLFDDKFSFNLRDISLIIAFISHILSIRLNFVSTHFKCDFAALLSAIYPNVT